MKPLMVKVFSIADLQAIMTQRMEGYVDDRNAYEGVGLDVGTKGMLQASHLQGYDATNSAWVGVGHATGGKVMLDAAE